MPLAASKKPVAPATTATTSTTAAAAAAAKPASSQKENTPTQTPAQNLAIRQLGAQAASVAASKKNVNLKISTTNPLLAEKVGGLMSPKSVIPGEVVVGGFESMLAGTKSPLNPMEEFHGRKVQSPGAEEIKAAEKAMAIKEESGSDEEESSEESSEEEEDEEEEDSKEESSEEDDDDDDDDDDDEDDEDDDDEEEDTTKKPTPAATPATTAPLKTTPKNPETTQEQPAKAADKAGVSVKD